MWERDIITLEGLFEQEVTASGSVFSYSIPGPEGVVAQVVRDRRMGSHSSAVRFMHPDHLGTPDTITDASGAVVDRLKFDPFGERRHAWALGAPEPDNLVVARAAGFTGHRASDRFGIIDMRGRVFDPKAGRFLSPDPLQEGHSQGLSRFSYVRNSPLGLVDPSGYQSESAGTDDEGAAESGWDKTKRITQHGLTKQDRENFGKLVGRLIGFGDGSGEGHSKGPLKPAATDQNSGTGREQEDQVFAESLGGKSSQSGDEVADAANEMKPTVDAVSTFAWPIALGVAASGNQPSSGSRASVVERAAVAPLGGVVAAIAAWKIFNGVRRLRNAEVLASRVAGKLPASIKMYGRCDAFAGQLIERLAKQGVSGDRVRIQLQRGTGLYSSTCGLVAAPGSFHEAVQVGDRVFDNLHPDGLRFNEYFRDLGGYLNGQELLMDLGEGRTTLLGNVMFTPF